MAEPNVSDWEAMKRMGRYLIGRTRVVVKFGYPSAMAFSGSVAVAVDVSCTGSASA